MSQRKPQPTTRAARRQPKPVRKLDPGEVQRVAMREVRRLLSGDRVRDWFVLPESEFADELTIPAERQFASILVHGGNVSTLSAALGFTYDQTVAALVRLATGAVVDCGGRQNGRAPQVS